MAERQIMYSMKPVAHVRRNHNARQFIAIIAIIIIAIITIITILVVKSKLPPRSGSSLEAVEPHP